MLFMLFMLIVFVLLFNLLMSAAGIVMSESNKKLTRLRE